MDPERDFAILHNQKRFIQADQVLTWLWAKVNEMCKNASHLKAVEWTFNPPLAAWMGGAWQRMIGTVKRALRCVQLDKTLSWDEFTIMLTQIEAIMNDRPLTYYSEREHSICPNDLILQRKAQLPKHVPRSNKIDWPSSNIVAS